MYPLMSHTLSNKSKKYLLIDNVETFFLSYLAKWLGLDNEKVFLTLSCMPVVGTLWVLICELKKKFMSTIPLNAYLWGEIMSLIL